MTPKKVRQTSTRGQPSQSWLFEVSVVLVLIGSFFVTTLIKQTEPEQLIVTVRQSDIDAAVKYQEDLRGHALDDATRQEVRAAIINDEVLFTEALRQNLHKTDSRVRKRLLSVMRSSMVNPPANPARPNYKSGSKQIQSNFPKTHHIRPTMCTLVDQRPSPQDLPAYLTALQAGTAGPQDGDGGVFGMPIRRLSRADLVRQFGPQVANALQEAALAHGLPDHQSLRHSLPAAAGPAPGRANRFRNKHDYIRRMYDMHETRRQQQSNIDALQSQYEIVVE